MHPPTRSQRSLKRAVLLVTVCAAPVLGACAASSELPHPPPAPTNVAAALPSATATPGPPTVPPTPSPTVVRGPLGRQIDEAFSRYAHYGMSGTFLVAHGDVTVLHKGYGLCNRGAKTACAPDTLFDVGSISKQFTATAIMRLQVEGKLNVSDALGQHVPGLPAETAKLTLHQLLTHTSGLADDVTRYAPGDRVRFLERVGNHPQVATPGHSFVYSNAGYSLLAEVVRRRSGADYDSYLENMVAAAGMRHTLFVPQSSAAPGDAAVAYAGAPGSLTPAPRVPWYLRGAGGVHTTTMDLLRWHRALEGDVVLPAAAKRKLYDTAIGDYAYGWHVQPGKHGKVLWHRGTIFGQQAMLKRYVEADLVVVYVMNQRSGWLRLLNGLIDEVIDGVVRELPPQPLANTVVPPLDRDEVSATTHWVQRFRLPSDARLELRRDGTELSVKGVGNEAFVLLSRPKSHPLWQRTKQQAADSEKRSLALLQALERGDQAAVALALPANWPVKAAEVTELWQRSVRATGAGADSPAELAVLGALPNGPLGMNTVVSVGGPLSTRYAGLSWHGDELRGLGMLPPMLPTAQVVTLGAREVAWLAKDGTLVRGAISDAANEPLRIALTWRGARSGVVATAE